MSRTFTSTYVALTTVEITLGAGEIDVVADPSVTTATVTLDALGNGDAAIERAIAAATITDGPRLAVTVPTPEGRSITASDGATIITGGTIVVGGNITVGTMVGGSMHISGSGATVHSVGGVRATVRVPVGLDIRARVRAGSITTTGPLAEVDAETSSGHITIAAADSVTAETASGDVVIHTATTIDACTGSGDVVVRRLSGRARVRTGSGDIRVHVAQGGQLRGRTGSGDITATAAPGVRVDRAELRTGSGDIRTP